MKPDKVLCCRFLFAFVALTVKKKKKNNRELKVIP